MTADLARFVDLARACIAREMPHSAVLRTADEAGRTARELTPIFWGCYDWHSAVHNHWLLARAVRARPAAAFAGPARATLRERITHDAVAGEARYLGAAERTHWELPYGLAWLLTLERELRDGDEDLAEVAGRLAPLTALARERIFAWLGALETPVRSGAHDQTAFSLGLVLDAGRGVDPALESLATDKARAFFLGDREGAIHEEPRGWDFLSPCLAQAEVLARVLPAAELASWLGAFLDVGPDLVSPAVPPDPKDYKQSHLDGLNLSRAWMLRRIAAALPPGDDRAAILRTLADRHAAVGLPAVTAEHYSGAHWLASYAVYLLTAR